MNTAEREAFLDIFMVNGGAELNKDDIRNFLRDYEIFDGNYLYKTYGNELYTTTIDALNIWHQAIKFEKRQMFDFLKL